MAAAEDTALKTALIPSGRIREEEYYSVGYSHKKSLSQRENQWQVKLKGKGNYYSIIKPLPPDRKYNHHCFIKAYFKNWHSCTRLGILIIWTFESIILFYR